MKRILLISLLTAWFYFRMMLAPLWAQVKPAVPVLQSGWSSQCVRALPMHEGTGTTLDDMSSVDAACTLSDALVWVSDTEGNYIDTNSQLGSEFISLASGLPGASIDSLTYYIRIKYTQTGALGTGNAGNGFAATYTNGPPADVDLHFYGTADSLFQWIVKNGSGSYGIASSTTKQVLNGKYNLIGTYDGANVKVYVNGSLEGTTALTGNIANDGFTSRVCIGQSLNIGGVGSVQAFVNIAVYTVCIWQRVLTPTEIAQIELAPYVMFGEGLPGGRRRQIVQ
jgi:hypothetical protein